MLARNLPGICSELPGICSELGVRSEFARNSLGKRPGTSHARNSPRRSMQKSANSGAQRERHLDAARQKLPRNYLTAGAILKEERKPSFVGERQFGRHFKRQFGCEGNCESKIAPRHRGVNSCREASRCLAGPSGWSRTSDVWEQDAWDFQGKSGSSGSCRLFLHFLGTMAVQKLSGKAPGSPRPRHPSSRRPQPSAHLCAKVRKRKSAKERETAQKGAIERVRVKIANNHKPGLGTPERTLPLKRGPAILLGP